MLGNIQARLLKIYVSSSSCKAMCRAEIFFMPPMIHSHPDINISVKSFKYFPPRFFQTVFSV